MNTNKRIKELYIKLRENLMTDQELNEFLLLIENDENKENLESEILNVWFSYRGISRDDLKIQKARLRKKLRREVRSKNIVPKPIWRYGIAASIAVVVVLSVLLNGRFSNSIEYSTGYGERETIHLPDGSQVELNANSRIVWDKDWEEKDARRIELSGEAFFEVAHLAESQKFIVSTSDLDIEVLGTSFNVSDRSEATDVFLSEGSVKLGLKGKKHEEIMMVPGQRISYSSSEDRIIEHKADNELAASWKNDVLYFSDKTVEEALLKVSQIYGVEFEFKDPAIKNLKLNFYVPYKDWDVAKEAFELTMNLKLELQENGKYLVSKN